MFAKHFEDEKHQFITKFNYLDQVTLDFLYLPSNTTELFPLNREQARELQEGFWKSKPQQCIATMALADGGWAQYAHPDFDFTGPGVFRDT